MINESVIEVMEAMGVHDTKKPRSLPAEVCDASPYSSEWWEEVSKGSEVVKPPAPIRKINNQSQDWILSPDGDFYLCRFGHHSWIYRLLGITELSAERHGWIKSGDGIIMMSVDHKPTQAQIDALYDSGFSEDEVVFK